MSSSSDAFIIAALNDVSTQLNRYLGIFIFFFGVAGNILNVCVLGQRNLRSNPCAWLFLVSSIFYGIGIASGLTSRPLSTWSADLTNTDQVLCKLRAFLLFDTITIGNWLITLATVDRWLSSSIDANRRGKSTLRNIQIGSIIIIVVTTIIEVQQLYCFEANLTNTPLKCYTKTVWCSILSDLTLALVTVLIPLIVMIIFGFMTISNIRSSRLRLRPAEGTTDGGANLSVTGVSSRSTRMSKKIDRRLMTMLLIQVLLISILTVPLAISKVYSTITRYTPKSSLNRTIENFTFNIFLLIFYMSCGTPFYIYTLSGGSLFRQAFFSFTASIAQKLKRQRE